MVKLLMVYGWLIEGLLIKNAQKTPWPPRAMSSLRGLGNLQGRCIVNALCLMVGEDEFIQLAKERSFSCFAQLHVAAKLEFEEQLCCWLKKRKIYKVPNLWPKSLAWVGSFREKRTSHAFLAWSEMGKPEIEAPPTFSLPRIAAEGTRIPLPALLITKACWRFGALHGPKFQPPQHHCPVAQTTAKTPHPSNWNSKPNKTETEAQLSIKSKAEMKSRNQDIPLDHFRSLPSSRRWWSLVLLWWSWPLENRAGRWAPRTRPWAFEFFGSLEDAALSVGPGMGVSVWVIRVSVILCWEIGYVWCKKSLFDPVAL